MSVRYTYMATGRAHRIVGFDPDVRRARTWCGMKLEMSKQPMDTDHRATDLPKPAERCGNCDWSTDE